jgi:uncharacterized membrane protein (Fun14 family)
LEIPVEYAWLVPILIPLVIGLLVGAIIKRTIKIVILIVALVIILIATSVISMTFQDVFNNAMDVLPQVMSTGEGALDVLPYSSSAFLIGLGLGLWKG